MTEFRFTADDIDAEEWLKPMTIVTTPFTMMMVLAHLVLALRHPEAKGVTSVIVKEFARELADMFEAEFPDDLPGEVMAEWEKELKGTSPTSPAQ